MKAPGKGIYLIDFEKCGNHDRVLCRLVADALRTNSFVTFLDLGDNFISDQGAAFLGDALKANPGVTSLHLAANKIAEAGAGELAASMKANICLSALEMRDNEIGDVGAVFFSEALKGNATLTTLGMKNNRIGPSGARMLSAGLRSNKSLLFLDVPAMGALIVSVHSTEEVTDSSGKSYTAFVMEVCMAEPDASEESTTTSGAENRSINRISSSSPPPSSHSSSLTSSIFSPLSFGLGSPAPALTPSSSSSSFSSPALIRSGFRSSSPLTMAHVGVKGTKEDLQWTVRKRYSEFEKLRDTMEKDTVMRLPFPSKGFR